MARQAVEIAAKLIAVEHMAQDDGITDVYWAPAENEIRLIEVTTSVEDGRGPFPFRFTPDPPDIPFPSVVIQVGPGDYARLRQQQLDVPDGFESVEPIAHP